MTRPTLSLLVAVAVLATCSCLVPNPAPVRLRPASRATPVADGPSVTAYAPARPSTPTAPPPRALPPIQGEPEIRLLVAQGARVEARLLRPALVMGSPEVRASTIVATANGDMVVIDGAHATEPRYEFAPGGANFQVGGRKFGGALVLVARGNAVHALEVLPLERYLEGVLAREVAADWPAASLEAQAIAARSYALAQWMRRYDEPWHLAANEVADMAYAGRVDRPDPRYAEAIEATRGQVLVFAGQPLPAYFHACSGGYTEDHGAVWPERRCPDGVTDPGPAMPAAPDPFALAGTAVAPARLGAWSTSISVGELADKLGAAGTPVGAITQVRIASRSGQRARTVRIEHTGGTTELGAHALRMAIGPRLVKSTLWTRFELGPSGLAIEGQGFGHGVGLSQASAWAMARDGHDAGAILDAFYPGASRSRMW